MSESARAPLEVRFDALRSPVDPRFVGMTFPAYRPLLALERVKRQAGPPDLPVVTTVALGACVGEEPVGLALGEIPDGPLPNAEMLSLYVAPGYRGRGLGTALLDAMGTYLSRMGIEKVAGVYMTGRPSQKALERVLRKAGWSDPEFRQLTMRFTLKEGRRMGWYGRYPLEDGYQMFPWKDLTDAERASLRESQRATAWIKTDLEPWKHDAEGFEPVSSLGIRLHGEIVGWVLTHALDARTVRFTCSFIRRDLGRRGKIVPAYSEVIRRLSEGTSFETCTLTVPVQHRGMSSFILRRCAPFAHFMGETRGSTKLLRAQAD